MVLEQPGLLSRLEAEEEAWGWQAAGLEIPLLCGLAAAGDAAVVCASKGHLWKGAPWKVLSSVLVLLLCYCCCQGKKKLLG